ETGNNHAVGAPEQGQQDWKFGGLLLQQLMHNQVVVANYRIHKTDRRADFGDVRLAPCEAERILNPPFDGHHLQKRVVEQFFDLSIDQRMKIPKSVDLHQICVITGEIEIRIVLQKQIGDVVQVNEAVQSG